MAQDVMSVSDKMAEPDHQEDPWPLNEDGYLKVDAAGVRSIVYHPSLNVILICGGDGGAAVRTLDVNSGVVLQASALAAVNPNEVTCKYIPGEDRVLFCDGQAIGVRSDYNGVLLLDSILQKSVSDGKQNVKIEIPLSEAIILKQSLSNTSASNAQVLNELTNVIANAQKQYKKGIKAQKWNTICLEVPIDELRGAVSTAVSEFVMKNAHTPELQVASAVNERLSELIGEQTNASDRKAMASEARRRETFSAWPHMDYKWALPNQMAQAGFYHQPNSAGDDRAMCFTCTVCLVCWERTDEPWAEHERHSPNCPFVVGEYTQNVPISVSNATAPAIDATYRGLNVNVLGDSSVANLLPTSNPDGLISVFDVSHRIRRTHSFYVTQFDSHILERFTQDFGSPGLDKNPVEKKITALSIVSEKPKSDKSKPARPTIVCGLHIRSKAKLSETIDVPATNNPTAASKTDISRLYLVVYDFMYSKDQEESDEKAAEEKDAEMEFDNKNVSYFSDGMLFEETHKKAATTSYSKLATFIENMDSNELESSNPYNFMKQLTSFYKTLIPGESDEVFLPPSTTPNVKKSTHSGPRLLSVDLDSTEADSSSASDLLNSNGGGVASDSYELSISDHIADLRNAQPAKKLNYSRAVQCVNLPAACRGGDLEIADVVPTRDHRHVLVTVVGDARSFLLLYALDFADRMAKVVEEPVASRELGPGERPAEVRLLPAADRPRRGEGGGGGGAVGSAVMVCGDGAVRVVELATLRVVCYAKIEKDVFVSAAYCASLDRLCASTAEGSLHFFALNDADDESAEDRDEDDLFGLGATTADGPSSRPSQREVGETMRCFEEPPRPVPMEELRMFRRLCGFTPLRAGEGYNVVVPPCWSEFQQAMRQRRNPSSLAGDMWTKTWRLQTDTTTWEEHVFEITLPSSMVLGHVDVHFTLQSTTALPHVEVTLLRQTKGGIGHGRDVRFSVDDTVTVDMLHWVDNPVTSDEYLRAHNADILAGPVNIAQHLDLTEQGGTVALASPKMFRSRVRNLLLHVRAVYKRFDAKGGPADRSSSRRTEFYMGCDCIHELSLAIYAPAPVPGAAHERHTRTLMLESNAFVQSLLATAAAAGGDAGDETSGAVLDVLTWIAAVRLTRNRGYAGDAPNHQLEFMFVNGVDENMRGLLRRCLLLAGRGVAHKCMRFVVTCCSGARNISKSIGEHFNASVTNALLSILDSIHEVRSAAGLQWLLSLLLKVCNKENEQSVSDRCVSLLRTVSDELTKRTNPYHLLLRSRYGLYGTPTESELFDIETLSVYSKLVSANENASNIDFISDYGFNKETINPRDVLSSNEMKVKCKNFISTKIVKGLIETQPLHFSCASTSEGTRLERADATSSLSNMISPVMPSVTLMETWPPSGPAHLLGPGGPAPGGGNGPAGGGGAQQEKNGGEKAATADPPQQPNTTESGHSKWITQMLEEAEQALDNKFDSMYKTYYFDHFGTYDDHLATAFEAAPVLPMSPQPVPAPLPPSQFFRPQAAAAAAPPCQNLPWQQLLTAPPKQVIVVERMQSGARRHVTLDFGEAVVLTDVLVPACPDLVSLTVDVWLFGEEIDSTRIATATDIGGRILLLNDLQPPPLCRFVKVTVVGRYGMSTARCRIPLGHFYGHVVVLPEEIPHGVFVKPAEVDKQMAVLSKLFEDISCRYSLSCSKLKDLLQPYLLADMKNIVHLSNYMNILKEKNRSVVNTEHNKIFAAYQEAILYQHQLNTVRNVMKRLEGSSQVKETSLASTSTDKLIHIAEGLLEVLLSVETTTTIDVDGCRRFFDGLCVSQTSRLQLLGAVYLERACGGQTFWGDFLADTLARMFSTSCVTKFPQDRLFVLLAYLSRRSAERSSVIDAALRVVHETLRPMAGAARPSLLLAVDVDLPLLSWSLMYLSLQLTAAAGRANATRWDWVLGEMAGRANVDGTKGSARKKTYKRIAPTIAGNLPLQSKLLAVWQKQDTAKDKAAKLKGPKKGHAVPPPPPEAKPKGAAPPARQPREVDAGHCLAVARGLLRLVLNMDHSASSDMMLLSFKVISRLIGLGKLQLCQLLNETELLALIDFCISCRIPWATFAVSCFLLDAIELTSSSPSSPSEIIEMDTDASTSSSANNWNQNESSSNSDLVENLCEIIDDDLEIVKTKTNKLISKLNSVNPLPSVYESEDSDFDEFVNDFEKIKSGPLLKSSKSTLGTPNNFSTTIDARLETGVSAAAEIQLIRLVAKHTSRLIMNVMADPKQKESDNPLNPWPVPPAIFPQETTLGNQKMLTNCFERLFDNLQNHDPFKIEQVLQLWLTLNCPTKTEKFDKAHMPASNLSVEAVSSLISALAWTPGLSLTAWCSALQILTLACNTNGGKRWSDPVTGSAESMVNHKDFEQMFLSLLSGSGLAAGKVVAGPTLCKCLHDFLVRLQMRCDIVSQSSQLGGTLKLHLLNIVYQLTKVGGPVASKLGPLDAQSKLLQSMQYMNFYNIDISIGMSILESTAVLYHNYVVQTDKIKCMGVGDKPVSSSSTFSDIFANVLGSDTNKTDRAVSYDDLLISLMKLLGRLVQTPIRMDQSEAMETETTPSSSTSQTDESKAEQIQHDTEHNQEIPATPFFADTVLQHQPTIVRLCKCLAACKSSSLCMLVKVFKKVPFWNLSEPNTVGDALFHILTLLALKASNKELLMRPLLTFLSQTPQLSEPMVWFILQVLDSETMIRCLYGTGGIEVLCAGIAVSSNAPPTICRTGTISTVMQHFSGGDRYEAQNDAQQNAPCGSKKGIQTPVDLDTNLVNFAPYCTITCQGGTAQPPEVLVQSLGMVTHRRARTALWSYHYYPEEIHTELLLQLPSAILLKEVQLQPHTGTLSTCPSFVALETSAYGPSRLTPACQPLPTSGLTFIRLQLPAPRVTDCLLLRLYKPRDSSSIGMLQVRVLGTHAFGAGGQSSHLDDDEFHCRHSLGWLRLLHHCFTVPTEPDLKRQVVEAASRVPNLLSICCGLLLVPSHILPDYLPCLEKVLKELALHNTENSLNAIRVLLDNRLNIIEPMLSLDTSWQDRLMINVSGYQSACELLYQICEHQDPNTGYRVQLLLRWFQDLAAETLQSNTNKCNAAYVSSIASILWSAKRADVAYGLEELITTELFDGTYDLKMRAIDNVSLKYALDSLLCSICYIRAGFFPSLLQRVGVLVPNLTTDRAASISDDRKDSECMTDDSKRIFEVDSEWYGRLVIGELSDLTLSREQLETVALASRSPTAVRQLLDSGLPKLLNGAIYEFCDGGGGTGVPMAGIGYVTAILRFFTDVSDEKVMRDWLGSTDGSSFWPHLLHWLCRKTNIEGGRSSNLQSEAHVQLEEICVKFLSKCCLCHPTNQARLAKVLCEVISRQTDGISGFLRRLVLQLLLENEKVPVSIEADDTVYKCSLSTQTYLPNHPAFKQAYNRAMLYLSTGTTLWDILDQHVYFNYAMKMDTAMDSKKSIKREFKQYFGSDVSDLSMAAGVTAKDKRAKDLKNQSTASTPQTKKKRYTSFSSDGVDNFNILVKCSAISEQPLPPTLSLGQLLRLIEAKGTSFEWPCVHLSVWQSKSGDDRPNQYATDQQPPPQPVGSALQVFSQMGGLALLAQHLPAVYPEANRSAAVPTTSERSTSIMGGSDSDWIKVDECDDTYEDLEAETSTAPPTKPAGSVSHIPHHSLAAFAAFLRLPGYAEVLLRDAKGALCLLRLALGVTDDGEGGDIFQSSIAHSLPTLPFEVLYTLYDSTPLCSDDGRLLRRISITSGVAQLLLVCLGIFTHHSNGNGEKDSPKDARTKEERQLYWAKGTGFGTGSTQQCWNVEQALLKQKNEEEHVTVLLMVLAAYISPSAGAEMRDEALPPQLHDYLANSSLLSAISSYLRNDSVLDMARHIPLYRSILEILRALATSPQLVDLLLPQKSKGNEPSLCSLLKNMKTCVDTYASKLRVQNAKATNVGAQPARPGKTKLGEQLEELDQGEGLATLVPDIQNTARLVAEATDGLVDESAIQGDGGLERKTIASLEEQYLRVMKGLQFGSYEMIQELPDGGIKFVVSHHFENNAAATSDNSHPARVKRIAQETVTLSTSLPLNYSSSVFVRYDTSRLDVMKVLITGPADTPYANGCFELDVFFPSDYPLSPMLINLETTGHHTVRFNPNLYNDGKVCLSVLNTWHGRPEEKWNSQTSSFLQVLVSIQSLILVQEPYFNEPGFERTRGTPAGNASSRDYNLNVYQATVRWAMLDQIANPCPCFRDAIHAHFYMKRDEIVAQVDRWLRELESEVKKDKKNTRSSKKNPANTLETFQKVCKQLKAQLYKLRAPEGFDEREEEEECPKTPTNVMECPKTPTNTMECPKTPTNGMEVAENGDEKKSDSMCW